MATWSTACVDWADRLRAGRTIIPPPIYPDEAERAVAIFKALRVIDLPGRPTFGECCDQFVFDFVAAIFGAYDSETGNQLIREFYLLISKKNGKSTIAAGIMMTALILCWREDEEHLILAPTKEIADNSFKPAAGMVRADDELAAMFHVQDHYRTITHRVTRASLKVVAADSETVSGKKSGRVLVDEHWLFGKRAGAEGMFTEALGGQVSRNEGWVIFLSTQSDDQPAGVFLEKLTYYRDVRDGKILDPKSLGVLYEFPPDIVESKGYLNPKNFGITNPNLGRSVSAEWLVDQLRKKQASTGEALQQFTAKHLNVQIGMSLRASRWSGVDFWEANSDPALTLEAVIARSDVLTIGIDGGGLDDLLGLCVLGRQGENGPWLHWGRAWAHPIVLERRKADESFFRDFERDGDLVIVATVGDDIRQLGDVVAQCEESGLLDRVGVDVAGIGAVVDELESREIEHDRIIAVPQGWKLTGAIKTVERKLAGNELQHGGRPMMAWCVGNARAEPRGNATMITKQISGAAKIDPLMALFDAAALMAMNPEPRKHLHQALFF